MKSAVFYLGFLAVVLAILLGLSIWKGSEREKLIAQLTDDNTQLQYQVSQLEEQLNPKGTEEKTPQSLLKKELDKITRLEEGTAGSTLKAVTVSANLLDWCTETQLTDEEIDKTVKDYYDSLTEEEKQLFAKHTAILKNYAGQIITGEQGIETLLESAGNPQQHESYTMEQADRLWNAISKVLI